ncbi:MAG TPA: flagellar basal body rod protein FlgC [Bacillales bacterium]|nr:flagellar basal body rod protein FlgC [Bacillales bacterium]
MSIFNGINISASALTAERLRMDVISSNLANANTTRARKVDGQWQPYRRKMVVMQPKGAPFASYLEAASGSSGEPGKGVMVSKIAEDPTPFKKVYRPNDPDANANGYVKMPNVDPLQEMVDLVGTTRAYEANVTALNASKGMLMKALQIGK